MKNHCSAKEDSPVIPFCYYLENRVTHNSLKRNQIRYFGKPQAPSKEFMRIMQSQDKDNYKAYWKIVIKECVFKSCKKVLRRSNNSFARTKNGEYIQMVQFIVDNVNNVEYTLCKKINVENTFSDVCTSILKISPMEENYSIIQTSEIDKLCVHMAVNKKLYISAIPNMIWY